MKNRNESGRTLFEMLDVLAIMTVLSLVGVTAYQTAMTHYKANEIWYDIQLRARTIRWMKDYDMPHLREKDQNLETFSSLSSVGNAGYKITGILHGNNKIDTAFNGLFSLIVHDVPKNVCEQVIKKRPDEIVGIVSNDDSEDSKTLSRTTRCVDGKNKMRFYFDAPNPCENHCEKSYQVWKTHCGTIWKNCNPELGFSCRNMMEKQNCAGGLRFQCTGYDGKTMFWNYGMPELSIFICPKH